MRGWAGGMVASVRRVPRGLAVPSVHSRCGHHAPSAKNRRDYRCLQRPVLHLLSSPGGHHRVPAVVVGNTGKCARGSVQVDLTNPTPPTGNPVGRLGLSRSPVPWTGLPRRHIVTSRCGFQVLAPRTDGSRLAVVNDHAPKSSMPTQRCLRPIYAGAGSAVPCQSSRMSQGKRS